MRPPRLVISSPDAAVAVHTNVGGTREQQHVFVRRNFPERLTSRSCHIIAIQIMHKVMADHRAIDVVIKPLVILRIILNPFENPPRLKRYRIGIVNHRIRAKRFHMVRNSLI